jgi:RNA polymerase sigma-70 factor (ECF subfamily)
VALSDELPEEGGPDRTEDNPEELALRRENCRELRQGLAALPARYREVLALHYLEECSVARISELLGIAEGTVKSLLSRGRQKLKEKLAAKWREADAGGQ